MLEGLYVFRWDSSPLNGEPRGRENFHRVHTRSPRVRGTMIDAGLTIESPFQIGHLIVAGIHRTPDAAFGPSFIQSVPV